MPRKPDVKADPLDAVVRRAFGPRVAVTCRPMADGVSTQVYRLVRGDETFYLRIAEERHETLEVDADLYRWLRDLGIKVPDVVFVDPFDVALERSVLITTEIPGAALAEISSVDDARAVARDAGRDLAIVNQVPVDGFGWVCRDRPGWPLRAEYATYAEFVTQYVPAAWPGPLARLFSVAVLDDLEAMIEHERNRRVERAQLAHGDFDVTPIFCHAGRYTGLIDFGEIRGTEPFFDLGHFWLHDEELVATRLVPALLEGYQEVLPLPPDHEDAIRRSAILIGLRQLCRWLDPTAGGSDFPFDHPLTIDRVSRISDLVSGRTLCGRWPCS